MSAPEPSVRQPRWLEARLENGLHVLGEPDLQAGTVALGYFVRTGARDEASRFMGASHFIEHLLFKGSERVGGQELNTRLDALGASVNAFTSEETTVYHAACLPEHGPELLALLSELLRPAFRAEDVDAERGVILEEIAMYADDPASRAFDELRLRAWNGHPLGHLVLGTPETVSALTPAQLSTDFQERYGTANMTLVASGQFDWEALLREAGRLTEDWPRGRAVQRHAPQTPQGGLHVLSDPDLARTQFTLLAPGLRADHPLREAAVVLADLLGGDNGRLYWALVDSGLADGVDLSHTEFQDAGAFEGGWSCDPERAAQTLALVRAELERVQREGVSDSEVARSRRKLAVGTVLRAETPYSRLFSLGMDYLYLGQPHSVEDAVAAFEKVTPADVAQVLAQKPFDHLGVVVLGPVDGGLRPLDENPAPTMAEG